jgi:glycine hydroxymethyltransferase
MVPFDDKSPFVTSGIRLGTPAITTRFLKESDMQSVVSFIDKVLMNADNDSIILEVKKDVNKMMESFPLYK